MRDELQELKNEILDSITNIIEDTVCESQEDLNTCIRRLESLYRKINTDELDKRITRLESIFDQWEENAKKFRTMVQELNGLIVKYTAICK